MSLLEALRCGTPPTALLCVCAAGGDKQGERSKKCLVQHQVLRVKNCHVGACYSIEALQKKVTSTKAVHLVFGTPQKRVGSQGQELRDYFDVPTEHLTTKNVSMRDDFDTQCNVSCVTPKYGTNQPISCRRSGNGAQMHTQNRSN